MRILKAFTFVAVAGALVAGQRRPSCLRRPAPRGSRGQRLLLELCRAADRRVHGAVLHAVPDPDVADECSAAAPGGTSTWGPTADIFCVDLYNNISIGDQYRANFTTSPIPRPSGSRRGLAHQQYLEAAYSPRDRERRQQEPVHGRHLEHHDGQPGHVCGHRRHPVGGRDAVANYTSVNAADWVVVTDINAPGATPAASRSSSRTSSRPNPQRCCSWALACWRR